MAREFPEVQVESREELRKWLEQNHRTQGSIWLITFKKAAGERYLSYDAIVEEAICFGWIDSVARKLDHERSMLRLSPRKPGSGWSRVNKERIERLVASGAMTPAGYEAIERARKDGSWEALDAVEALTVPQDLRAALDSDLAAAEHWERFPRSAKRGILEWIASAKRPETRQRRIEETVRLAAQNMRALSPESRQGAA